MDELFLNKITVDNPIQTEDPANIFHYFRVDDQFQRKKRMNELIRREYMVDDQFQRKYRINELFGRKYIVDDQFQRKYRMNELFRRKYMVDDQFQRKYRMNELFRRKYMINELFRRKYMAILNADTREEKMTVVKKEVYLCNRCSFQGFLSLAPIFLPCAGGTGHGSGQPEHQGHSEIYPSTLNVVSNCPSRGEYMQTSLTKCAEVCGSYMQDGNCAYHCMRDSSKTKLVEFCAKPKPFFDYCPEYDPVDQTIQKDFATLCNSTSTRNYYNSSDIYFCDPNNCLQLHESSVRNGATTLTTLMNETTEINDGDSQEWLLPLFIVLAALLAVIIIGYILYRVFGKCGIFSEMRKKRNQNGKQYVYTRKRIPDYV